MADKQNQAVVEDIQRTPVIATWMQTLELGYETPANTTQGVSASFTQEPKLPVCFHCGKSAESLSKCAKCNIASYCSKECQVQDWKAMSKGGGGHKGTCAAYGRLGILKEKSNQEDDSNNDTIQKVVNHLIHIPLDQDKEQVRNEIFGRIRIYACSYAVHRTKSLGRGFLFLQSDSTLATLSTPIPKDALGHPIIAVRAILMHFLTLGEFDAELCRDDFELTMCRTKLQEAVNDYDEHKEVVLLMRFRCGHLALGKATLVPDRGICSTLGQQYFGEQGGKAVQLNLDDI